MKADILTKAMNAPVFKTLRELIGVFANPISTQRGGVLKLPNLVETPRI